MGCRRNATSTNLATVDLDPKTGKRLDHELALVLFNLPAYEFRNEIQRVAMYVP